MNKIANRLKALRAEMAKANVDAWYISGTDPHASEYLPARWKTRSFISGFNGSFGSVVVTKTEAGLWTDTRYFLQAENELAGTEIKLHKLRVPEAVSPEEWLAKQLVSGAVVGIDPQTISVNGFRQLKNMLGKKNINLLETADFFENIWENRPELSNDLVFDFPTKYCGNSRIEKHKQIAALLEKNGTDFHVISTLDELAWFFNLRGSDITYNPVFTGFGLVGKNEMHLFVDPRKLPDELYSQLKTNAVQVWDYDTFYPFLSKIKGKRFFIDPSSANYSIFSELCAENEMVEGTSLIALQKAIKNQTELDGFKQTMIYDGVALVEFLFWLKNSLGKTRLTEYSVGRKLAEFRTKQPNFKGESFTPIVGYKAHGAIVHLSVTEENALEIEPEGILLFDSGGQYLAGTTDITRTVALGQVSEQQKKDFTIVLKGMIGLTLAEFPFGTKGCHLDILARKPMWENGMNYGHGTGHGIGHFLNVHEGPMAIRQEYNENKIEPGMVLSNEPAFYREGEYGLRTENMMVCVEKQITPFGRFLSFETLSLCPIDTSLVIRELLTTTEINWLNEYHRKVNNQLKPQLNDNLHGFLDELTREI
ncbi:MAG TPA: hypothetical protein DER09_09355 [Prolixibacteraceae bacterium]|nr:hypothetical protein [Prolixibacteraceae bacterium]